MRSRPDLLPAPMSRIAVVAPVRRLRRVLVELADTGAFELDPPIDEVAGPIEALARATPGADAVEPRLSLEPVDADALAASGAIDLLLGEASLERHAAAALDAGPCRALPGWMRAEDVDTVRSAIAPVGGALVTLPGRRGLVPPTSSSGGRIGTAFRPLVSTYATVPYRDIDPTMFAALAYVVMFGMMFGDVGHGLAIVATGAVALAWRGPAAGRARAAAPFLIAAGVASTCFGFLYGAAFGPTGLVPALWLRPLEEPERLLIAGLVVGGVLLAATFAMSTANRWREGGAAVAVYDPSGIAGSLMLVGIAGTLVGLTSGSAPWSTSGLAMVSAGASLAFLGLFVRAGSHAAGLGQALVELFDTVLRLGSNIVSFTRLAAFGLTHAVITEVVWDGSVNLWHRPGPLTAGGAIALFTIGNFAAFALGALVGAIQALRLEYYELFSRLFVSSGRPFDPWHVAARRLEHT